MGEIQETKDHGVFATLKGNREVDDKHVKQLKKLMGENGNLTANFPIVVNGNMEVIDGQHRLQALRELGWPVFYTVQEDLNLDTIRAINVGQKNWGWKDYAESYAKLGIESYSRFLKLHGYFGYGFSTLLNYAVGGGTARPGVKSSGFYSGDFKFDDQEKAFKMLKQYQEVTEAAEHQDRDFAVAMARAMRAPEYDHQRMVHKMAKFPHSLQKAKTVTDYLRAVEDIYNMQTKENEKVRLF